MERERTPFFRVLRPLRADPRVANRTSAILDVHVSYIQDSLQVGREEATRRAAERIQDLCAAEYGPP
jgi:hypothetical protein